MDSIIQKRKEVLFMHEWPSEKPYAYRAYTGECHLYYCENPTSHLDELICSKVEFDSNKHKGSNIVTFC